MFELAPAVGMSGNYQIKKSLRFNSADSAYLARTPSVSGNQQTFTFSCWIKLSAPGALQRLFGAGYYATTWYFSYINVTGDQLQYEDYVNNAAVAVKTTTQVFRDPSAHYHIVVVRDSTNATAGDRIRIYVNGVRVTSFSASTDPAQNAAGYISSTYGHRLGVLPDNSQPSSFYLSEVNFIDGQTLTPSSFGKTDPTTGQWVAKRYVGTYGTNGFYLPFNDGTSTTTLGYDRSGNSNNWTLNNFTRSAGVNDDWFDDTPTNNYCTLNPLHNAIAPTNGALVTTSSSVNYSGAATLAMQTGKWYWECSLVGGSIFPMFGVVRTTVTSAAAFWATPIGYGYYFDGNKYTNSTPTAYGASYTTNDIIGVAFDVDAGTLTFYKNGVSQGVAFSGLTSGDFTPAVGQGSNVSVTMAVNFGQRPFAYTPPAGYKTLCTKNLPTPAIKKGSKHFDAKTYTGTGATQSVAGLGFQPDFLWIKSRTNGVASHRLFDATRGTNALYSNLTNAEANESAYFTSLDTAGFTVTGNDASTNASAGPYVAWNWKAGNGTVSNAAGTITSTVSANPTAGFSIVTYTGTGANATVGHGLGVAPSMVIIKNRNSASVNWGVWHSALLGTQFLNLNTTGSTQTLASVWNSTIPNSSVFSLGSDVGVNANTSSHVAYCFAEVPGYSKIGKYTGNGLADGPFIYCGFKPKYILFKRTDTAGYSWCVYDMTRESEINNGDNLLLLLDGASAESTATARIFDFLSNGFKARGTDAGSNASGGTYIFMAFAEAPFKYSTAR